MWYGIYDDQPLPFRRGERRRIPRKPQTGADLAFEKEAIEDGLRGGLLREGLREEAMEAMEGGSILSSAFVVWQEA